MPPGAGAGFPGMGAGGFPGFGAPAPPGPGLDFSALLQTGAPTAGFGSGFGFGAPPAASPAAPPAVDPAVQYASQLQQLQDMGFTDAAANIRALVATSGNVNAAIERLFGGN